MGDEDCSFASLFLFLRLKETSLVISDAKHTYVPEACFVVRVAPESNGREAPDPASVGSW